MRIFYIAPRDPFQLRAPTPHPFGIMIGGGPAVAACKRKAEGCWFIQVLMPCAISVWRDRVRMEIVETMQEPRVLCRDIL